MPLNRETKSNLMLNSNTWKHVQTNELYELIQK